MALIDKLKSNLDKLKNRIRVYIDDVIYKAQNMAQSNYELGLYHMKNHKYFDASLRIRFASYLEPENELYIYDLIRCYIIREKFSEAQKHINILLPKTSNHEIKSQLEYIDDALNLDSHNENQTLIFQGLPQTPISWPLIEEHYTLYQKNYLNQSIRNSPEILQHQYNDNPNNYPGLITINNAINMLNTHIELNKVKIMDLGCGYGEFSNMLKYLYPNIQISALDGSSHIIQYHENSNLYNEITEFVIADYLIENTTQTNQEKIFNQKYDLIIADLLLVHFTQPERVFEFAKKLLTNNGKLLCNYTSSKYKNGHTNKTLIHFAHNDNHIRDIYESLQFELIDELHNNADIKDDNQDIKVSTEKWLLLSLK